MPHLFLSPSDLEMGSVLEFFLRRQGFAEQAAQVLRRALDEVIDGIRTGRWSVASLEKTEKTYIGTKVEILLKFEFELADGDRLDTRIEGVEVDIKCTVLKDWMIPQEAINELCLLVRIDDDKSKFWIGLIRADKENLRTGQNRDRKVSISAAGKMKIRWIVEGGDLPINFLATLPHETLSRILSHRSGQARIDELLRLVQGRIIPRVAIETVARQKDPMKRVRDARINLRAEGLLVLGHQGDDPQIALEHGYPVPQKGEIISIPL